MQRLTPADKGRADARLHPGDTEKVHTGLQPVRRSTRSTRSTRSMHLQSLCLQLRRITSRLYALWSPDQRWANSGL